MQTPTLPQVPAARIVRNGKAHVQISVNALDSVYANIEDARQHCRAVLEKFDRGSPIAKEILGVLSNISMAQETLQHEDRL